MRATTVDDGREVTRAALWFAARWLALVALALGAAAVIAAGS